MSFFLARVAPLFQIGCLDAAFWSTLVPQLSRDHPTVSDAMVSIALLVEHPLDIEKHGPEAVNQGLNSHQLKALKRYARAVARVTHRQDFGAGNEVTALLTCVLFTSLEFQTGNESQALALLEKGVQLLFTYLQNPSRCETTAESKSMAEIVVPFFSRHAIFIATLGLPLMSGWSIALRCLQEFKTGQAALQSCEKLIGQLHSLKYRAHHLIRSVMLILHNDGELDRLQMASRQQTLLASFQEWHSDLLVFGNQNLPAIKWICANLFMYFLATYIWVSCCLSRSQDAFDRYTSVFRQIIGHASNVVNTSAGLVEESTTYVPSAFAGACISPLYFTATKCRDPMVRRSALEVIRRAPQENTIWSLIPTSAIIEAIIAFEEHTAVFLPTPTSAKLPAEHQRVHHVQLLAQRNLVRLFTYKVGHPSEPEHVEAHVVNLPSTARGEESTEFKGSSEIKRDTERLLNNFMPDRLLTQLFDSVVTASDESPKHVPLVVSS